MLVHHYLLRTAHQVPEKVALVCGPVRKTYRELAAAAESFAGYLLANGLERGERVALYLDNSPETVIAFFGILQAGGCSVGVNPNTPGERLGYILENSKARFIVASTEKMEALAAADTCCSVPPGRILTGDRKLPGPWVDFGTAVASPPAARPPSLVDLDLAVIIYTSGSTGQPKGVTLTHRNIDTVTESVSLYLENNPDDIILQFLPLSIGYGLLQLLVTFRVGARLILEKVLGYPYEMIRRIVSERVTGFAGVPTVYSILTQMTGIENEDFSSLRYITNAAAAMPPAFIPKLRKLFPTTRIYLMHGLTECMRTTYLPPEEIDRRPTSVGRGMRNVELWIEGPDGKRLPPGEVGELVVRGSNVMPGYWNDPEGTARVLKPGRYPWERALYTRDLFRMDEEGYFYFVARADEVIKSKGLKISPLEIEDVIYTLKEVQEVRVIGVPDELLGQSVKAEIVLKKGMSLTVMEVKGHCLKHLEEYKVPHTVAFVASLPKTDGGKIKRLA